MVIKRHTLCSAARALILALFPRIPPNRVNEEKVTTASIREREKSYAFDTILSFKMSNLLATKHR